LRVRRFSRSWIPALIKPMTPALLRGQNSAVSAEIVAKGMAVVQVASLMHRGRPMVIWLRIIIPII
jgi:hypothetical protein